MKNLGSGVYYVNYSIKLLLQNGVTALHNAACNGHPDTCEVILKNNPDVNAETKVRFLFCFVLVRFCFVLFLLFLGG